MTPSSDPHLTPSDLLHLLWLAARVPGASEPVLHLTLQCAECCEPGPVPEEDQLRLQHAHFSEESLGGLAWAVLFYGHPRLALGLRHIASQCTRCWSLAELLFRNSGEALTAERAENLVQRFDWLVGLERGELGQKRQEAPTRLKELLAQPQTRRLLLVRNSSRYRSASLADVLCQASRKAAPRDSEEALALGELATEVAERLDPSTYGSRVIEDLHAFALAVTANALRVAHRLEEAETYFRCARRHQTAGTGLPAIRAEIDTLEASLFATRRSFPPARRLLASARASFLELGDTESFVRVLLKDAYVCREAGEPEEALRLVDEALPYLDDASNPQLLLCALHSRMVASVDLELFDQVQSLLPRVRRLTEEFGGEIDLVRLRWVEGEIAAGLGRLAEAAEIFETEREQLLARGLSIDAALISLDLCRVYRRQGRVSRLRRMAGGVLAAFREQRVEHDVRVVRELMCK